MSGGGFQPGSLAEYYCGDSFVPCRVLYAVGELCFCQFETRHWAGYKGYCVFTTTAVFPEHLRPATQPGPEAIGQASKEIRLSGETNLTKEQTQGERTELRDIGDAKLAGTKPVQPEPSKPKLNGKQVYAGVRFPTRSPARVRTISGLTLKDYLGHR